MSRDLVVALSGGIGGAKLALGLSRIVEPRNLIVVANVGDDFEHLRLHISPDADTLMYTLAGLDNTKLGWGRRDETLPFMSSAPAGSRRASRSPPSSAISAGASASVPESCPRPTTGCGPGCGRTRGG